MKRLVGISVGVVALGLLAYLGNSLLVQAQPVSSGGGGTRVAAVNMYVVMKGYKKVEVYKQEMQQLAKPFDDDIKKNQHNYNEWVKISKDEAKSQKERDDATKYALYYKRKVEDKRLEASKILVERGQKQIVQIYREMEDAIQRYAKTNGIHIVLQYLEPIEEQYSAQNIDRKLNGCGNSGACSPIYLANGVDISEQVLQVLNQSYASTGGATPTGN